MKDPAGVRELFCMQGWEVMRDPRIVEPGAESYIMNVLSVTKGKF